MRQRFASYPCAEPLETRRLLASTLQVQITPVITEIDFNSINNLPVRMDLNRLPGIATFVGTGLTQSIQGRRILIDGTVSSIQSIDLINTTLLSSMSVHLLSGSDLVPLNNFSSSGPLFSLALSALKLEGNMKLFSAPRVTLGAGERASVEIDSSFPMLEFSGGDFNNTRLTSNAPIFNFHANKWTVTPSSTDPTLGASIKAPAIALFQVNQDMEGDVTLTNPFISLGAARAGSIGRGNWTLNGCAGLIDAGFTRPSLVANFTNLGLLRTTGNLGGTFIGKHIGAVDVGGDLFRGNLLLSDTFSPTQCSIGCFHVAGNTLFTAIRTTGNIDSFTCDGGIGNSSILAGLANPALPPQSANDFLNPARINYFSANGFTNSRLAAYSFGTLKLQPLDLTPTPVIFTTRIDNLSGVTNGGQTFSQTNIQDESDLPLILVSTMNIF